MSCRCTCINILHFVLAMHSFYQVREESPSTRLWFVTTGYLVRLLAHQLESFSKYTHLVIDEVHERSADGDIICLLAKKVRCAEWST